MVCQRLREGGGYHQEDVKQASAGKDKKGCQKRVHERLQDDERHGSESKCVAHEDKAHYYMENACMCVSLTLMHACVVLFSTTQAYLLRLDGDRERV